jgi:hypothetical protein
MNFDLELGTVTMKKYNIKIDIPDTIAMSGEFLFFGRVFIFL